MNCIVCDYGRGHSYCGRGATQVVVGSYEEAPRLACKAHAAEPPTRFWRTPYVRQAEDVPPALRPAYAAALEEHCAYLGRAADAAQDAQRSAERTLYLLKAERPA
jgi:hypothetical protein